MKSQHNHVSVELLLLIIIIIKMQGVYVEPFKTNLKVKNRKQNETVVMKPHLNEFFHIRLTEMQQNIFYNLRISDRTEEKQKKTFFNHFQAEKHLS